MSKNSKIVKMFGALVLGGGMILTNNVEAQPPAPPSAPEDAPKPSEDTPKPSDEQQKVEENPYCQLEFTFIKYDRERKIPTSTCLDDKSDAEILKIINDSKKKTCQSPFCGCWLG